MIAQTRIVLFDRAERDHLISLFTQSAASNYTTRSYSGYGCSGSSYSYSNPTGANCTVRNQGTAAQYYQATYCSALAPTAIPTASPTGPSYKPTPQPTTPRPTGLPTVAGAINAGYIAVTGYSDSYTCSTVSSVSLYRLGVCIAESTTSSYKYLNYDAARFASTGDVQVEFVEYSDGSCGTVSRNYYISYLGKQQLLLLRVESCLLSVAATATTGYHHSVSAACHDSLL